MTVTSLAMGFAMFALSAAQAQGLSDPTRPPGAAAPATAGMPGAGAQAASGLTVVRRQGGKPAAVINGQLVVPGSRVDSARVIRIDEDSVVLQDASGRQALKLTPGIGKQPSKEKAKP